MRGTIFELSAEKKLGFIKGEDELNYGFSSYHLASDNDFEKLKNGKKVEFNPTNIADINVALGVKLIK